MTVAAERQRASRWLGQQASKPPEQMALLQRPLFLVTGYTDEAGACWQGQDSITRVGPRIYRNWNAKVHVIVFPTAEILGPEFGALGGRAMDSFVDFGDLLREMMLQADPAAAQDEGYDLICHSMGGLDALAALMHLQTNPARTPPAPAASRLGRAYHYITLDTPFRGVPNMDFRRPGRKSRAHHNQGSALFAQSQELALLGGRMVDLPTRVRQVTCYRPSGVTQLEVPANSADLYGTSAGWAQQRAATDYACIEIRGASHSGGQGITRSPITLRHIFETRLGV